MKKGIDPLSEFEFTDLFKGEREREMHYIQKIDPQEVKFFYSSSFSAHTNIGGHQDFSRRKGMSH